MLETMIAEPLAKVGASIKSRTMISVGVLIALAAAAYAANMRAEAAQMVVAAIAVVASAWAIAGGAAEGIGA